MKCLISKFLLAIVVPIGSVALAAPSLAATFDLPSAFTFGNQSFTQVYANDNGTLSFGAAYLPDGPGLNFLTPPPSVQGVLAGGFGSYSTANNWTSTSLANGTRFNFSGFDSFGNGTNVFTITLLNNNSFQFAWNAIQPSDPNLGGSISIGLYVPGNLPTQEANPGDLGGFALNPNTLFYYDYSLNGASNQNTLNGATLASSVTVPEPTTVSGMIAFGSISLLLGLKRSSKKASH